MLTIIVVVLVVLVIGGGGYGMYRNPGPMVPYSVGGLILTILVVFVILRLLHYA